MKSVLRTFIMIFTAGLLAGDLSSCRSQSPSNDQTESSTIKTTLPTESTNDSAVDLKTLSTPAFTSSVKSVSVPVAPNAVPGSTNINPLTNTSTKRSFDDSDSTAILACGGVIYLNTVKDLFRIPRYKHQVPHAELYFDAINMAGLDIPNADPMSIQKYFSPEPTTSSLATAETRYVGVDAKILADFTGSRDPGSSYWIKSNKNSKTMEFSTIVRSAPKSDNGNITYEFFAILHDSKNEMEKKMGFTKRVFIHTDLKSAWWLYVQMTRVAECMQKSNYVAADASKTSLRGSLLNWFFYSLFSDQLKLDLAGLN